MKNVMDTAIKIINKIKGGHNALTQRKFKSFLDDLHADYGDLLLHTEVRWLSRGKSLERFFNLRQEIVLFFKSSPTPTTDEFVIALEDKEFQLDLAFLCDLTEMLNDLNLTLQSKNTNIITLVTIIHHFNRKLHFFSRLMCSAEAQKSNAQSVAVLNSMRTDH